MDSLWEFVGSKAFLPVAYGLVAAIGIAICALRAVKIVTSLLVTFAKVVIILAMLRLLLFAFPWIVDDLRALAMGSNSDLSIAAHGILDAVNSLRGSTAAIEEKIAASESSGWFAWLMRGLKFKTEL